MKTRSFVLRRGIHFGTRGKPFPELLAFKQAFTGDSPPEVLLFGDSVWQRVAAQDKDRRVLGDMVAGRLAAAGMTSHVLARSSYTPVMYEAFLALAGRLGTGPAQVVLPVNLRCLSPQWNAYSIWQFLQDQAAVEAQIVDPDSPIPALEPVIEDIAPYHAAAFASPLSNERTVRGFRETAWRKSSDPKRAEDRARELLVFHYGMPARRTHRQIAAVSAAAATARDLGIRAHVYLSPINMELIRRLGGCQLESIVKANAALVREAATGAGDAAVTFSDWLDVLPPGGFFHDNELTEHLCEAGRRELAAGIAAAIEGAVRPGAQSDSPESDCASSD